MNHAFFAFDSISDRIWKCLRYSYVIRWRVKTLEKRGAREKERKKKQKTLNPGSQTSINVAVSLTRNRVVSRLALPQILCRISPIHISLVWALHPCISASSIVFASNKVSTSPPLTPNHFRHKSRRIRTILLYICSSNVLCHSSIRSTSLFLLKWGVDRPRNEYNMAR